MELQDIDEDSNTWQKGVGVLACAALGLLALGMGAVKVRNELLMTKAYVRQADALERLANVAEGMTAPPPGFAPRRAAPPSAACDGQAVPQSGYWPAP